MSKRFAYLDSKSNTKKIPLLTKNKSVIVNVNPINLALAQHGITSSKLRKIGADHASRIHGGIPEEPGKDKRKSGLNPDNDLMELTDQKHLSDSIASKQKDIRGIEKTAWLFGLDEQNAGAYKALSGQIRKLKKKLDDYHSQHNTLERRVKGRITIIRDSDH
ncbi:hypothetical protein C1646_768848 [Rhizophagus diaphanus]|nr:hypothetical protein C1646_768848 [Rhizophagus diaphanus] [Rhizophagus sp. MUCL 43196]